MALDPKKLSRNELVQLLNSTPLGECLTRSRLDRQMNRAGRRWHDGRRIRLLDYLRDREILLVLDGLEQVQEADARFLTQLLRAAPDIVVIVTSRERINLQEEWAYPVRGLDFPAADGAAPLSAAPARYSALVLRPP